MNAIETDPFDLDYSDGAPVLIAASSDAALARAVRTIEAGGARVGGTLQIETARERIEQQVSAKAIWLELDRDCGAPMDELLDSIGKDVADGRYAAVVSGLGELIDPLTARLGDSAVELIVDASEAQRVAALAIATASAGMNFRLSDIASDQNAARLRQLSDEVSRIAATLARLSSGPAPVPPIAEPAPTLVCQTSFPVAGSMP